mmetsp:Transcript_20658/g.55780  ORF Transcript_20658/g.55780 Transcript_20658/m.55780 type:complete len:290 (-) Transcript_20658:653-1522(-)
MRIPTWRRKNRQTPGKHGASASTGAPPSAAALSANPELSMPLGTASKDVEGLRQLAGQVEDGIPPEATPRAVRFLRARKHNVDEALDLWQKDEQWRRKESIGEVLNEDVEANLDATLSSMYAPVVLPGRDVRGRFVMYRELGPLDVKAYEKRKVGTLDHLVRRHVREMERLRESMERCDSIGPLGGHLSILDLKGTSLSKFLSAKAFWQAIGVLDQNHYAEMLGTLLIINPPPLTETAVNMVRNFIDPATAAKIQIRSGDPRKFMHEYVEPQYLPAHLRPVEAPLPART